MHRPQTAMVAVALHGNMVLCHFRKKYVVNFTFKQSKLKILAKNKIKNRRHRGKAKEGKTKKSEKNLH